jgi:hypothetical protein
MDEISNLSEACERMSGKIFRSGDGKENEPYERRNPAFGSPPILERPTKLIEQHRPHTVSSPISVARSHSPQFGSRVGLADVWSMRFLLESETVSV